MEGKKEEQQDGMFYKSTPFQPKELITLSSFPIMKITRCSAEHWIVGASMDTTFKIDTALNLDCDQIFLT